MSASPAESSPGGGARRVPYLGSRLQKTIEEARAKLDSLTDQGAALPEAYRAWSEHLLDTLSSTLEELQVAGEELQEQADALSSAYADLQVVRTRYEDLFEFAPGGYVVTDTEGVIQATNRAATAMLGARGKHLEGKPLGVYVVPGDRAEFYQLLERLGARDENDQIEWETRLWVAPDRLFPATMTGARILDGDGEVVGLRWLVRDISAQRETQEALIAAERQALVGRLASSLAHEIGNPLQTVVGCLGLAREALSDRKMAQADELLEMGREELHRASAIVDRLREVHQASDPEDRESLDLNALIPRVLALSEKHCAEHHVEVVWKPGAHLPAIEGVQGQIQQVFLNLVLNAVDAMPEGGVLTVRTAKRGTQAQVAVADTGVGIPKQRLGDLFRPFSTTKARGMGLGLFVCDQIVREHEGTIRVRSRVGKGTTFIVTFPAGSGT